MEQLNARKKLLEEQKELKHEMFKQSIKEYEDYIKEEKRQWEIKKQYKWQFRKDLNDQIKSSKELIVSIQYSKIWYTNMQYIDNILFLFISITNVPITICKYHMIYG